MKSVSGSCGIGHGLSNVQLDLFLVPQGPASLQMGGRICFDALFIL